MFSNDPGLFLGRIAVNREPTLIETQIEYAVRAFQQGRNCEENFRRIMEAYSVPVSRYLRRRIDNERDLEDLTQEVFIRVYKGLKGFKGDSSFKSWLFAVAHNTAVLLSKRHTSERRRRAQATGSEGEDPIEQIPDPDEGPLASLVQTEISCRLQTAIEELPERMRLCSRLRFQEGRAYQEIADEIGISIQTVKAHLFQAKAKLMQSLGKSFSADLGPARDVEP